MGKRRLERSRFLYLVVIVLSSSCGNGHLFVWAETQCTADGYQDVQDFCDRNYIKVVSACLACDTPGAYYYGGNAYRNSPICMSQDKANLEIVFTIPSNFVSDDPLVEIETGSFNSYQTVIESTSLCMLPVTSTADTYIECPKPGEYLLETSFTMPNTSDYDFHYQPDLRLTFTNENGVRLGCATTGAVAVHIRNKNHATQGLVALGICVVGFILIFGLLIYLSYRRKKRLEKIAEKRTQGYQYFRTLPSGQVVNLSTHKPILINRSAGSEEGLGISNPAYNETRIPTRPII